MGIAIQSRTSPKPAAPVVLAFKNGGEYELAWPCPYCGADGHRHAARGLNVAPCGKGVYLVRWCGGKICN
ncbi:MAG TPA: hypothetical protein VMV27_14405 [Candidatus Binataceae bacterium]|nr:hypothetical protein [Candidatus Binataceae bacterium]